MKTTGTLLLSLLLVSSCRVEDYLKDKITPQFNLLEGNQDYEKREYEPSTWLRTHVKGSAASNFLEASKQLKSYVDDQRATKGADNFDQTWPVLINHTRDNQLWLSWFVPPGVQLSSGNPAVEIFNLPKSTFYVRKFSGQPSAEASKENTGKLLSSLGKSCPNMDLVEYSGAGYESYFSLKHHNEIWISQDFSCAGSV